MAKFIPPADMDEECISLCTRLNELGDVRTFESCCGHLRSWYSVWFECRSFVRLAKLYRCVDRNYSDGKWEILVDGTDVHPAYRFWLRSKEVFETYEEMEESVNSLIGNIDYWDDERFASYFEKNGEDEDAKEMYDLEQRKTLPGYCDDCGCEDAEYIPDPYAYEMWGNVEYCWLCPDCAHERAMDV